MSASEGEIIKNPRHWGTCMSDFRAGSRIHSRYAPSKPGPKKPNKHRHKKRLAKGLNKFSHFVKIVTANMQESAPELGPISILDRLLS
ncbi:hypothetical protein F4782DRAFT_504445 [Xylaria castorea]|nr:hypothetical protein F4782DRAFT_504445 [Xylaria castorea]